MMIKPYQTLLGCVLVFGINMPVSAADAYRVDYEIETQHTNGVTTIQKYSEKLIRDDHNVWIERLNVQHAKNEHDKHDHHHDFSSAIQWIEQVPNQKMQIRYVLPESKIVVQLQQVDVEMLGLHQCWSCYHMLFDEKQLDLHKPEKQGKLLNYQWSDLNKQIQLIWNPQDRIVQSYHYYNPASHYQKQITVTRLVGDIAVPWQVVQQYSQRDYADFSD